MIEAGDGAETSSDEWVVGVLLSDSIDGPRLAARSGNHTDFDCLPDDKNLFIAVADALGSRPTLPLFHRPSESGWQDTTFAEFGAHVTALARWMLGWGVAPGDRVVIFGRNSYEWVVADYAALSIGAIVVPIYPTASEEQVTHILADSGARYGFAETLEQRRMLTTLGAGQWRAPVLSLADALNPAVDEAAVAARFAERGAAVTAHDIATIVYTSGTTGSPKGCVLTHRNMFASSANTVRHLRPLFRSATSSTLLGLPLSHIFGRSVLLACLLAGTTTGLVAGIPDLFQAAPRFRPTFLALVPYALEKIRKQCRGAVDERAERIAVEYGRALTEADDVDPTLAVAHRELDRTVFAAVRERLGGRCDYVICGGASLDATTDAFFAGIGVRILGAYGLTEAATAVTINEVHANRRGSVGRPIPGTTVAVTTDDEVLVSGANISPGYWPLTTPRVDDWLSTGDLGRLDQDGYLYITGRRKEILITSGGKNVAPTPLEDRIRLHPLVSNCMVIGEARSFVAALITVDTAALATWAADRGIHADDRPWHERPEVLAEVRTAIDDANQLVSRAESIRAFRVVSGDFTVENGQLTPSLKLRRAVIERVYAEEIAELYR